MAAETPLPDDARAIVDDMRQRLAQLLIDNQDMDIVDLAGELLAEFESLSASAADVLRDVLEDAISSGFVSGGQEALATVEHVLPPRGSTPKVPPVELPQGPGGRVQVTGQDAARQNLLQREVLEPDDYYALDSAAKQHAFTITTDVIDESAERFREGVLDVIQEQVKDDNIGFGRFKDAVLDKFESLPISKIHLEQVFRNNTNEAFAQGQEKVLEHPLVQDEFPYREYYSIHDGRVREEHEALDSLGIDGTAIYHKDDETWIRFRPPWDWNCRCGWRPVSIADAAAKGVKEAQQWLETGEEPAHPPVPEPKFSPDPRWERRTVQLSEAAT